MSFLQSIRGRLIALSIAILLFGLIASGTSVLLSVRSNAYALLQSQTESLANSYARVISEWVDSKASAVKAAAPLAAASAPSPELLLLRNSAGFDTTYIGWADKRIVFSHEQNLPPGYDPTSRPWYQSAAAKGEVVLTDPYADAATKRLVVTFANPVKEGSGTSAVVGADIFLDKVVEAVRSIHPTPSSYAILVSGDGKVIASPDASQAQTPVSQLIPEFTPEKARDWAAKGVNLLGVKAVVCETFERIHRSNLVGMGVLPLQFVQDGWQKLELTGEELVSIRGLTDLAPRKQLIVELYRPTDGRIARFPVRCRIDTPTELEYFKNGGVLHYVLRNLAQAA